MNNGEKLVLLSLLIPGLVLGSKNAVLANEAELVTTASSSESELEDLIGGEFDRIGGGGIIDDFKSIFDDVIGFFKGLEDLNQNIVKVNPPDWKIVKKTVESNPTVSKDLAQKLENRDSNSFHSIQDEAEHIQRKLIAESISESTTSIDAQKASAELVGQIEGILERSGDLSKDSSKSDVSQQILQNISEQNGITTQLLGIISSQNVQSQKDRANQTNLLLQSSRQIAIANNRKRYEAISTSEYGFVGLGSMASPTFLYEEETD